MHFRLHTTYFYLGRLLNLQTINALQQLKALYCIKHMICPYNLLPLELIDLKLCIFKELVPVPVPWYPYSYPGTQLGTRTIPVLIFGTQLKLSLRVFLFL